MKENTAPAESTASKRPPTTRFFGIGSAGLNLLEQLLREGLPSDLLIAVHSDVPALLGCPIGQKVQLERQALRPVSDTDAARVRAAAEEQSLRFKPLCTGIDVIIIVSGLGGTFGTMISPVLASTAQQAGCFVVCFAIMPFDCEGSLRCQTAAAGLTQLQKSVDLLICLPNEKALALVEDTISLLDTFKSANRLIVDSVFGAWRAFANPGIMGVPFLELCAGLRQHARLFSFAMAKASGPNRVTQALESIMAHPLLHGSWHQSAPAGVWIAGGSGLAIAEVNRIMGEIHRKSETPVLMGASIVPELSEAIIIGILAAKPEESPHPDRDSADALEQLSASGGIEHFRAQFLDDAIAPRQSRFVPPPPALPPDKLAQFLKEQGRIPSRAKKTNAKLRQTQLPLEIVSKGRFDKSEPTIHKGEDLDVPTYIRRGIALN